jgi:hypothetical protein
MCGICPYLSLEDVQGLNMAHPEATILVNCDLEHQQGASHHIFHGVWA